MQFAYELPDEPQNKLIMWINVYFKYALYKINFTELGCKLASNRRIIVLSYYFSV